MKKPVLLLALGLGFIAITNGQNYMTKNGKISFFSKTSLENIDAVNNQAVSVLNTANGDIGFSVLINGFLFKKALMQEHFNENYMESDKYPKAGFKGRIADIGKVNFTKDGIYPIKVSGSLTLHNVTRQIAADGTITIKAGKIAATSDFDILLADYNISIPKVVESNISKTIKISVDCLYEPKN